MRKLIIALVLIAATGVTALSVAKNAATKTDVKVIKVQNAGFLEKGFSTKKDDVSSAD